VAPARDHEGRGGDFGAAVPPALACGPRERARRAFATIAA